MGLTQQETYVGDVDVGFGDTIFLSLVTLYFGDTVLWWHCTLVALLW